MYKGLQEEEVRSSHKVGVEMRKILHEKFLDMKKYFGFEKVRGTMGLTDTSRVNQPMKLLCRPMYGRK